MKIKTGVDLVHISRLDAISPSIRTRFIERVFTVGEITQAENINERLAGFFAVKEAVSKALGTGIGTIAWKDIEVISRPSGEPLLTLHGKAALLSDEMGLESWSISISHSRDIAVATAAAIGDQ